MEGKVGTSGDLEKLSGSEGRCPECAAMDPGIGVPPLPLCQRVEIRSCPPPSALPLPSTPYISFAPCTSFPVPLHSTSRLLPWYSILPDPPLRMPTDGRRSCELPLIPATTACAWNKLGCRRSTRSGPAPTAAGADADRPNLLVYSCPQSGQVLRFSPPCQELSFLSFARCSGSAPAGACSWLESLEQRPLAEALHIAFQWGTSP